MLASVLDVWAALLQVSCNVFLESQEFDGVLALKILQDLTINPIEFRGSLRTEIVSERDAAFTWKQQFNIELRTLVLWSVLAEIFGV
jgi:hypothetical protein